MSRKELRHCLQALLVERFRLKFHRETREGSVYSLTIAKNSPKLREHSDDANTSITAFSGAGKANIMGIKVPLTTLVEYLSGQAGRPVIDNTRLKAE